MMATKKAAKKATKKTSKKTAKKKPSPQIAIEDSKEDVIFACIKSVFADAGLGTVTASKKVDWSKFTDPPDILNQLGDGIRDCIDGKGFTCKSLVGVFKNLRANKQVTVVSDLVAMIGKLVN